MKAKFKKCGRLIFQDDGEVVMSNTAVLPLALSYYSTSSSYALAVSRHSLRRPAALAVSRHSLRRPAALAVSRHSLRRPEKSAVSCSMAPNVLLPQIYSGSTERRYSSGS
jgi:hypothetical protein